MCYFFFDLKDENFRYIHLYPYEKHVDAYRILEFEMFKFKK